MRAWGTAGKARGRATFAFISLTTSGNRWQVPRRGRIIRDNTRYRGGAVQKILDSGFSTFS